jgi:nitrate reductase (NAD(P)H)
MLNTFQKLASEHKDQFKAWFTVGKGSETWKYSTGQIDEEMMHTHLYDVSNPKTGTFLCGPPGLIEKGITPILTKWGAKDGQNVFGF